MEAYTLYLQARHFARLRRGPEDFERAIRLSEQALTLDPDYAPAWVALAYARNNQVDSGYVSHREGLEDALAAIRNALELDDELAEAWAVLGEIKMELEWDWSGADEALRRARELEPENPEVLRRQAELAGAQSHRLDEALQLALRAVALDPLNLQPYSVLGGIQRDMGRLDSARATLVRGLELYPDDIGLLVSLVEIELLRSRPEVALGLIESLPEGGTRLNLQALAYHALGWQQEAETALAEYIDLRRENEAYWIASAYAFHGRVDKAFEWLEVAYAQHDTFLRLVETDVFLSGLHDDPRWLPFLRKMGLAD